MNEPSLKLLIVDDEAEIREGISSAVPWSENGIEPAGLASNGREALQFIHDLNPDMMLLDIRMPVMDGLEVLKQLSGMAHPPKVVILSGYDEFEYCQQALRFGVSDYLLKPCLPKEILNVMTRVRNDILNERNHNIQWENLKEQFQESKDLLREKLLIYLIQHDHIDMETALIRWQLYQMELVPGNLGVALVRIDNLFNLQHSSGQELELIKFAVRNLIEEVFKKTVPTKQVICDYNDDLLILWNLDTIPLDSAEQFLEQIRGKVESSLAFTVTIGLGYPALDLAGLYSAFNSSFLAVEYSFWIGPNRIIRPEQIKAGESEETLLSLQDENEVIQSLRMNDIERLQPALDQFFDGLTHEPKLSREQFQKKVTALICSIYHVCLERGLQTQEFFGPNLEILDELARIETVTALKQKLLTGLETILARCPVHKNSWKIVNRALQYLEEYYNQDLSLENVAQQVFVSPGYLSTLFKQELQKNFVDCLHEIRIEKAKAMLKNPGSKIYEIALKTGYKDEKYFSQIFKKITGMTPNQYRDTIA